MAGNEVTLTFAGDAGPLRQAANQAEAATQGVATSTTAASTEMTEAARSSSRFTDGIGKLGAAAAGMSAAIGDAGGTVGALVDFQNHGAQQAREHARALAAVEQAGIDTEQAIVDLKQAQLDLNQSFIDAKQANVDAEQAQIDARQALLDAAEAQKAYNQAVKEHGAGSAEAQQAAIDLAQANADLKQANLDAEQAQADLAQAQADGKQATVDMAQAQRSAKDGALDLAEAQSEVAGFKGLAGFAKDVEALTPLILGLVGVTNLLALANTAVSVSAIKSAAALVAARVATVASAVATGVATAAQWLWNAAFAASGIGAIIIAIGLLVAGIVWVATQTDWFGKLWQAIWSGIVTYLQVAKAVWSAVFSAIASYAGWVLNNYRMAFNGIVSAGRWLLDQLAAIPGRIGAAFSAVFGFVTAPFRAAFNFVARAWNNTIGRLSWTIPGWVPGVGGNSISAPKLREFHRGGVVPGAPGTEMVALLQAGERVTPPGVGGAATVIEIRSGGSRLDDLLVEILARAVSNRGGDVQLVLGGRRG